jgi:hypothetical protein
LVFADITALKKGVEFMQPKLVICLIAVFLFLGCSLSTEDSPITNQQSDNTPVENKYYQLGNKLKETFIPHNNSIYLATVNGEPINLNEWNYMVYYMEGKKIQEEVFQDFVKLKTQVAAAKIKGLTPSSEDISQIMNNTLASLADKESSLSMLLQGAELTGDEYCEIMKPQWMDKLAASNWQIYANDYLNSNEEMDLGGMDQADFSKAFDSMAIEEFGDLEVIITEDGIQAGMNNSWINNVH